MEGSDVGTGVPLFRHLLIQVSVIHLTPPHAHQDFMS